MLFPFGAIYGAIGLIRRNLYYKNSNKRYSPMVPTICIGNLAVGGTGKTPMVEYLVRLLQDHYKVATLSRGYKRATTGFITSMYSEVPVTAANFGDEPAQLHTKFPNIQVAVCEKRAEGIQKLLKTETPPEIILLDDAYQHLQVRCGLNVLLTDFSNPYPSDFPLPAGNLREFPCAARPADIVIVTKCPSDLSISQAKVVQNKLRLLPKQSCFFTTLAYDSPVAVTKEATKHSLSDIRKVFLLSGIANPKPLLHHLSSQFSEIELIEFGDHHQFTSKEIENLCKKIADEKEFSVVMTTEKDWTRLQNPSLLSIVKPHSFFVVPVRTEFLFSQENDFNQMISTFIERNI